MRQNFLTETVKEIASTEHTVGDIAFLGSSDGAWGCTWDEFKILADFCYDVGYGTAEIPGDFVIVFSDGSWLGRGEYDGSEWWCYYKAPGVPEQWKTITNLNSERAEYPYSSSVEQFQALKEQTA